MFKYNLVEGEGLRKQAKREMGMRTAFKNTTTMYDKSHSCFFVQCYILEYINHVFGTYIRHIHKCECGIYMYVYMRICV